MAVAVAEAGQDPLVRRGKVSVRLAEGGEGEQAGLVRREVAPLAPPGSAMLRRVRIRDLFLTT